MCLHASAQQPTSAYQKYASTVWILPPDHCFTQEKWQVCHSQLLMAPGFHHPDERPKSEQMLMWPILYSARSRKTTQNQHQGFMVCTCISMNSLAAKAGDRVLCVLSQGVKWAGSKMAHLKFLRYSCTMLYLSIMHTATVIHKVSDKNS